MYFFFNIKNSINIVKYNKIIVYNNTSNILCADKKVKIINLFVCYIYVTNFKLTVIAAQKYFVHYNLAKMYSCFNFTYITFMYFKIFFLKFFIFKLFYFLFSEIYEVFTNSRTTQTIKLLLIKFIYF